MVSCVFVACDGGNKVADNTEHLTDITKTLTLTKDYKNKSFFNDGIGVVRVDAFTDGDTTRFYSDTDGTVNVRYYSIDTPESTTSVEKWGKAASTFVKERLSEATEIVVESSTGGEPEMDSYHTRWLGYVWYKTADHDFYLLNLEIVENGYSKNNGSGTAKFAYNSYFAKAESAARKMQLRVFSKLDDPLYNDDPVEFAIKDFEGNEDMYYDKATEVGAKVIFEAYIVGHEVSKSGTHMFEASQFVDGVKHSINVYTGYNSNPASNALCIGTLYKFVGTVQLYGSGYQISNISYSELYDSNKLTVPRAANVYLTFSNNVSYKADYDKSLYTGLTVTEIVSQNEGQTVFKATASLVSASGTASQPTEFTVTANNSQTYKVGDFLMVNALRTSEESTQLTLLA